MYAKLNIQGTLVEYDPSLHYLEILRIPPEYRNDSTPLVGEVNPIHLEDLANAFVKQGRPEMLGKIIEMEFLCLYQDLKEGKLSYVDSRRDEKIGTLSDLDSQQIASLNYTLNLYKTILQAVGRTKEMEYREMIYGDREWSKDTVLKILDRFSGCGKMQEILIKSIDRFLADKISNDLREILLAKRKELE